METFRRQISEANVLVQRNRRRSARDVPGLASVHEHRIVITRDLADKFIGMYVNDYTRDYGEMGRKAVRQFLETAHERGYIDKTPTVEFVE